MTTPDHQPPGAGLAPKDFLATAAALSTIEQAVADAQASAAEQPSGSGQTSSQDVLATLMLLRQLRDQLARWEPGLIETARNAGASWAELAQPLGVASRQAAERRYLRVRPGSPGATGEERVQATRSRRAADRTVTAWARTNAADLRQLAGQITALPQLPEAVRAPLAAALAEDDAAGLLAPLTDTHPHLAAGRPDLATRLDVISRRAEQLRHGGDDLP